jgi:hypothetical protein
VLWWVHIHPDACRSLLFSALCFSFADPGGKELKEREKEKKEKQQISWDSLTLFLVFPSTLSFIKKYHQKAKI